MTIEETRVALTAELIEKMHAIEVLCKRHNHAGVVTSTQILANRILKIIEAKDGE